MNNKIVLFLIIIVIILLSKQILLNSLVNKTNHAKKTIKISNSNTTHSNKTINIKSLDETSNNFFYDSTQPTSEKHLIEYNILMDDAQNYYSINKFEDAISILEGMIYRSIHNIDYIVLIDCFSLLREAYDEINTIDKYENIIISLPDDYPFRDLVICEHAMYMNKIGNKKRAYKILQNEIERDYRNVNYKNNLAILYTLDGDYYNAEKEYLASIEITNDDPSVYQELSELYIMIDKPEIASAYLMRSNIYNDIYLKTNAE